MKQNIKIAKEFLFLAKELIAENNSNNTRIRKPRNKGDIVYKEIGFLDNPWRDIFYRWFDGLGDWKDAPFGAYLMKNESLRNKIIIELNSKVNDFLESKKEQDKIETCFHAELKDNGYFTGYQLLHGTTKYKGTKDHKQELELNLELKKKTINGEISIIGKAHCVWHDTIDANKNYFGEYEFAELLKKFTKAKDYKLGIPFDFEFKWKRDNHGKYDKEGYPWNNQTK